MTKRGTPPEPRAVLPVPSGRTATLLDAGLSEFDRRAAEVLQQAEGIARKHGGTDLQIALIVAAVRCRIGRDRIAFIRSARDAATAARLCAAGGQTLN